MDHDGVPRVTSHLRLSFTNMFSTPWKQTMDSRLDAQHPIAWENTRKQGARLWLCWTLTKSGTEQIIYKVKNLSFLYRS